MNKQNKPKKWQTYGRMMFIFALIRGIPKNKDNNKTYYKEGLKDSLFSSYILYILLVIGFAVHPKSSLNGTGAFLLSALIMFIYTQIANIIRIFIYKDKYYTIVILKYILYTLIGYSLFFIISLALGWI